MRYGADHKQLTRQRVLRAAANQIRERGVERVALAGVMEEAGLTHGAFYAHFRSKDDFIQAAVEQMFTESPSSLLRQDDRSPRDILSGFLTYYLSGEHRDTRVAGCPLPFLTTDAPRCPPAIRERLAAAVARMTELIARQLGALGHPRADDVAASCVAEVVGAVILARAEPDRLRSDAILARTLGAVGQRMGLEVRQ